MRRKFKSVEAGAELRPARRNLGAHADDMHTCICITLGICQLPYTHVIHIQHVLSLDDIVVISDLSSSTYQRRASGGLVSRLLVVTGRACDRSLHERIHVIHASQPQFAKVNSISVSQPSYVITCIRRTGELQLKGARGVG